MSKDRKYMTVVFEYEDGASYPLTLTEAFCREDREIAHKTYVSAIGTNEDLYSNIDYLNKYLEHYERYDWDGEEITRILNGEKIELYKYGD